MDTSSPHHCPAKWRLLPPVLLAKIFEFLKDDDVKDFFEAGSTCKMWRNILKLPKFWKFRYFNFRGAAVRNNKEAYSRGHRAAQFMRTFGKHLKYMDLDISLIKKKARKLSLGLEELLNAAPQEMKLDTFGLGGFNFEEESDESRNDRERTTILNALLTLLSRQTCLKTARLQNNFLNVKTGSRILNALANNNDQNRPASTDPPPATLTCLNLDYFFLEDVNVQECPAYLAEIGRFSALKILFLDFQYINDQVLERLSSGSPHLEALALGVDMYRLNENLMPTSAGWLTATQRCPKLEVFVKMSGTNDRIVEPGMPLASLSIWDFKPDQMDGVANLMRHLNINFASSIKMLSVESWDDTPDAPWNKAEELVELVAGCPSLICLSLQVEMPIEILLQVAAARPRSASLAPLQIHLRGESTSLGNRDLQRLAEVNPFCRVRICHATYCSSHPYKPEMDHD